MILKQEQLKSSKITYVCHRKKKNKVKGGYDLHFNVFLLGFLVDMI